MNRYQIKTFLHYFAIGLMLAVIAYIGSAHACTAFLTDERVSGMNKICYYDHLGSEVAVTMRSIDICKLSIQVRH